MERWVRSAGLLLGLALVGCREAQEPFSPPDPPPISGQMMRLTFSAGDDRAPVWSPDGDTIYYSAESFPPFPDSPGVLVALAAAGGPARLLFEEIQTEPGIPRSLTVPTVSSRENRIGFVQVLPFNDPDICLVRSGLEVECTPAPTEASRPRLDRVALRVRDPRATGTAASTPHLFVEFASGFFDASLPAIGPRPLSVASGAWVIEVHPFHTAFETEGVLIFRGSLSPDGRRMAYSDGLGLHVWNVEAGNTRPIPGTEDGVSAAWSPDGAWIAFTRYERGPPVRQTCEYFAPSSVVALPDTVFCIQQRTTWPIARRVLSLVRPDGTDMRELGVGEDAAWTPDSKAVFFRRNDRIHRLDLDDGTTAILDRTSGGREPAVSPDGGRLVFARRDADGTHDIWVMTLDPRP